jgi:phenylacetic acid degradation operon negative regulatory protein
MNARAKENERLESLIEDIVQSCKFRAPSLIVTVLGDSLAPHGGTFWMGSLIELMAPLGLGERLVRTATFRLTKEGWLSARQVGRKSYYSLTKSSVKSFREAFRRVYTTTDQPWDGEWCLVFLNNSEISAELREQIKEDLFWHGFGTVSANVFAHPSMDIATVRDILKGHQVHEKAMLMRGRIDGLNDESATISFIRKCWDVDKLAADYTLFLDRFRPLWRLLHEKTPPDPRLCFIIRTTIIHEYRRLTLRDPHLPAELLSPDWAGGNAHLLCRNLYRLVYAGAEKYLLDHTETADGPLPAAGPEYYSRFGGLN